MQKTYFCYVYVYAQEFISNMINKRYVLIPHEVDLFRMEGICEKFKLSCRTTIGSSTLCSFLRTLNSFLPRRPV
jgi:hypothetical protein